MNFNFIKYKENENLKPIEVKNKAEYLYDLEEIKNSSSGRVDVLFLNTFILPDFRTFC